MVGRSAVATIVKNSVRLGLEWGLVITQSYVGPTSFKLINLTRWIILPQRCFLVINLGICGRKISQTISKVNICLFDITRFYSVGITHLLIKLIFIIGLVFFFIIISKDNIIISNILFPNGLLFFLYIMIGEFFLELWTIVNIFIVCDLVLVTDWKIVLTCVLICLLFDALVVDWVLWCVLWLWGG